MSWNDLLTLGQLEHEKAPVKRASLPKPPREWLEAKAARARARGEYRAAEGYSKADGHEMEYAYDLEMGRWPKAEEATSEEEQTG